MEFRHLERRPERARISYLRGNVIGQVVLHAGEKNNLRKRAAADTREVGSKILRRRHAVDLMAGRAAIFRHQLLAASDAGGISLRQVNVGEQIVIFLPEQEAGKQVDLLVVETVV